MRALFRDWLCYQNDSMSPVAHPASVEGPLEAFLALALVLLRGLARRADLVEQDARHRREPGADEPRRVALRRDVAPPLGARRGQEEEGRPRDESAAVLVEDGDVLLDRPVARRAQQVP